MSKRAHHRSDEEWHQIILAARSSGLNDFEYCRSNGIPRSTSYRALARLRLHACEIPARAERPEYKQEVVPINISELPISKEARMTTSDFSGCATHLKFATLRNGSSAGYSKAFPSISRVGRSTISELGNVAQTFKNCIKLSSGKVHAP